MAAKRITQSNINWSAISERIPDHFKPTYNAFKGRCDTNLRKMMALPEKSPAIDWAFYKSKVAKPGLVDTFQKKYESLQIPYPSDTQTAKINEVEKQLDSVVAADIAASNKLISEFEARLAAIAAELPISQMTYQEFTEAYPELSVNASDPTPWPHDEDEIKEFREQQALLAKGETPPASH